jgi:hypothetical protein
MAKMTLSHWMIGAVLNSKPNFNSNFHAACQFIIFCAWNAHILGDLAALGHGAAVTPDQKIT